MNICVNCKFCYEKPIFTSYAHDFLCKHPNFKNHEAINPITGIKCYFTKTDYGDNFTYTTTPFPTCYSINKIGNCKFYEFNEELNNVPRYQI
jgi:hypothetical protein